MDKFGSAVDRMYLKLGSNVLCSLRFKTQLLKMLQYVIFTRIGLQGLQEKGLQSIRSTAM
jgi:hypothetical protein